MRVKVIASQRWDVLLRHGVYMWNKFNSFNGAMHKYNPSISGYIYKHHTYSLI